MGMLERRNPAPKSDYGGRLDCFVFVVGVVDAPTIREVAVHAVLGVVEWE